MRVEGSRIRKEKVADLKISGYVRGRGLRGNCLWPIGEEYQIGNKWVLPCRTVMEKKYIYNN